MYEVLREQVTAGMAVRCAVLERACGAGAWTEREKEEPMLAGVRR